MENENYTHEELEEKISNGQALLLKEREIGNEKVQYIANMQFDRVLIIQWNFLNNSWSSKPMTWLMLSMDELNKLHNFCSKIN